jgi:hypothetical protein
MQVHPMMINKINNTTIRANPLPIPPYPPPYPSAILSTPLRKFLVLLHLSYVQADTTDRAFNKVFVHFCNKKSAGVMLRFLKELMSGSESLWIVSAYFNFCRNIETDKVICLKN